MTSRFLEILKEIQEQSEKPVLQKGVLIRGPFWYAAHSKAVKNRYNDVVMNNVTQDKAEDVILELNKLENNA